MDEFDVIEVPQKLHIIVSVKDFRNILHHAQLTSGELAACYSNPGRPMKLSYRGDGILCEYILMTVGEKDATGQRGAKRARGANQAKPAAPRPELEAAASTSSNRANSAAPSASSSRLLPAGNPAAQPKTPARPRQSQFQIRPPPLPPPSTLRSESLFVAQDEDQQWEPVNADEDADGEEIARLEWDNNQVSTFFHPCAERAADNPGPEPVAETHHQPCCATGGAAERGYRQDARLRAGAHAEAVRSPAVWSFLALGAAHMHRRGRFGPCSSLAPSYISSSHISCVSPTHLCARSRAWHRADATQQICCSWRLPAVCW